MINKMLWAIVLIVVGLGSSRAEAHPFHVTIAEIEHNVKSKRLEVALKTNAVDLEAALSSRAKMKIELEQVKDIDERITAYLIEVFEVRNTSKKPLKLKWVGKEVDVKTAWLYFEIEVPDDLEGLRISNRIFFELESDQTNTVNLKRDKTQATLRFTKAKPWADLSFPKSSSNDSPSKTEKL